jgi:hypothetical protein
MAEPEVPISPTPESAPAAAPLPAGPQTSPPAGVEGAAPPEAPAAGSPSPLPEPATGTAPEAPATEAPKSAIAEAAAALAEQPKPTETPPEAPEAPVYDFKLPDGVEVDGDAMGNFTGILGEAKVAPEAGQRLLDLYLADRARVEQQYAERQQTIFDETRSGWRSEFNNDPEYGGNRAQTTINTVVGFLRHYAKDDAHFQALIQAGEVTGWNDNPQFIRLIANAAKGLATLYREPAAVVPMSNTPVAQSQSRYARRYGNSR